MANTFMATTGWRYGGSNNKSILKVEGTLVIDTTATGGATAGDLPASMFGLQKIRGFSSIVLSDNSKNYVGTPAYDNGSLMVAGGASNAPMDLPNGTYLLCIEGYA